MIDALMPTYARANLAFSHGEGAWLFGTDGRRYLDFCAGIAVTSLGHCHPHLVKALTEQAQKLWHCSNLFEIPGQKRMADRLVENSFADSAFFTNSGAEANEGAIKIARKYHYAKGNKGRYRMIVTTGSFHGRTMMTVAAGDSEKARKGFDPLPDGFDRVAFGNLNELRAAVGPETAGILVEPITGEGGIRAASPEYLQGLRKVADEFDLILCYDEIQCGMGRTGKLFAHEWSGAAPDVMTLAKGIGGGFPMAAILANERAAAPLVAGSHGTTFGGNPLAMACGNAVLDVILAPGFLARVEKTGAYLRQKLAAVAAKHPKILAELRGSGLMLGLKCVVPAGEMMDRLREAGLLTVSANDNVVRILPPLIVGEAECDQAAAIIDKVAAAWPAAQSAAQSAALPGAKSAA